MGAMFFAFDGLDGVGKSTQIERFAGWLRGLNHEVVTCRDPGSTALGEAIRELLLEEHQNPRGCRAEMFLYMAARAQLVDEVIDPALEAGKMVVSDRYLLANVAYQGHAGTLDPETVWRIGTTATHGIMPEITFLLDMPLEMIAERFHRPLDRMEQRGDGFRRRVREGFLAEAARFADKIVVIDASRPVDAVQEEIRAAAIKRLGIKL